jgi:hypothetical protein
MKLGVSYSLQTRFRRGNCPLPYNIGTACTAKTVHGFGANTTAGEAAQNPGSGDSRAPQGLYLIFAAQTRAVNLQELAQCLQLM